jgi:hypothetical protein
VLGLLGDVPRRLACFDGDIGLTELLWSSPCRGWKGVDKAVRLVFGNNASIAYTRETL